MNKNNKEIKINENTIIRIWDYEKVKESALQKMTSGKFAFHFGIHLDVNDFVYQGKCFVNSNSGLKVEMDSSCPYEVKLKNMKLAEDSFDFEVVKKTLSPEKEEAKKEVDIFFKDMGKGDFSKGVRLFVDSYLTNKRVYRYLYINSEPFSDFIDTISERNKKVFRNSREGDNHPLLVTLLIFPLNIFIGVLTLGLIPLSLHLKIRKQKNEPKKDMADERFIKTCELLKVWNPWQV